MPTKMPKYISLYSELRRAILSGTYPAGSLLPTENELMEQYNVSKTTIRHAVQLLKKHKLVSVRQGFGTKVLATESKTVIDPKYQQPGSQTSVIVNYVTQGKGVVSNTNAVIDTIPAAKEIATALGIETEENVYRLQRLQIVDGVTFGYMINYIPVSLAKDLNIKTDLSTDLYGILYHEYGIQIEVMRETVDTVKAGFLEVQFLQVPIDAPLLILKRIASSNVGVVEYCETIVRPDIFRLNINTIYPNHTEEDPYV